SGAPPASILRPLEATHLNHQLDLVVLDWTSYGVGHEKLKVVLLIGPEVGNDHLVGGAVSVRPPGGERLDDLLKAVVISGPPVAFERSSDYLAVGADDPQVVVGRFQSGLVAAHDTGSHDEVPGQARRMFHDVLRRCLRRLDLPVVRTIGQDVPVGGGSG